MPALLQAAEHACDVIGVYPDDGDDDLEFPARVTRDMRNWLEEVELALAPPVIWPSPGR